MSLRETHKKVHTLGQFVEDLEVGGAQRRKLLGDTLLFWLTLLLLWFLLLFMPLPLPLLPPGIVLAEICHGSSCR